MQESGKNLKGTWAQAVFAILFPVFLVLTLRWLLFEPYVIPSGSMIPTLQVHDHILVNKFAYGVRFPFSKTWLWQRSLPQRGEVIVFRYPKNPSTYYVKRVIGLPGDEISYIDHRLVINGEEVEQTSMGEIEDEGISLQSELLGSYEVNTQVDREGGGSYGPQTIPEGHLFVMGDNRDASSDSRVWGFVPTNFLIGRAWFIWLSCEKTFQSMSFLCDPSTIRRDRLFRAVHFLQGEAS